MRRACGGVARMGRGENACRMEGRRKTFISSKLQTGSGGGPAFLLPSGEKVAPKAPDEGRELHLALRFAASLTPHPPLRGDLSPRGRGSERGSAREHQMRSPFVWMGSREAFRPLTGGRHAR